MKNVILSAALGLCLLGLTSCSHTSLGGANAYNGNLITNTAAPVQTKTLTWNDLYVGNAHESNGTLVFYSDGRVEWTSLVWTDRTRSGDQWKSSFEIRDKDDVILFKLEEIQGPKMEAGNPPPHHHFDHEFRYDPKFFNQIAKGVQHSNT